MPTPKISVIIVYNNENNLYDCIQSLVQQSFSNIEVICVNNGSKDNAEKIVMEQAQKIDRIRLISMPEGVDSASAKRAGLAIAGGEFVIFMENNETVTSDFLKNAYVEAIEAKKLELKDKYLYRRSFIENDREVTSLVEDKVKECLSNYSEFTEDLRQKILVEFDKFNRNSVDNLKNSANEVFERFHAMEKEFYNKDWKNQERMKLLENSLKSVIESKFKVLQNEFEEMNKHITEETAKKEAEITALYEEIEKGSKISIENAEEKAKEAVNEIANSENGIFDKINALEKEIILRYVNLKRITDIQFDEIRNKLAGG